MTIRTEMQKARETHVYILGELEAGNYDAVRQRYEQFLLTPARQRECIADYDRWLAYVQELEEALREIEANGNAGVLTRKTETWAARVARKALVAPGEK